MPVAQLLQVLEVLQAAGEVLGAGQVGGLLVAGHSWLAWHEGLEDQAAEQLAGVVGVGGMKVAAK